MVFIYSACVHAHVCMNNFLKQTNLNSLNSWIKLFSFWLKVKFKLKICFTPMNKHPEFVFKPYSLMNYNIWQKNFRAINCFAAFKTFWLSVEKEVKPHSHMCALREFDYFTTKMTTVSTPWVNMQFVFTSNSSLSLPPKPLGTHILYRDIPT